MGDLLWPFLIVGFLGVVFLLIVSFIRFIVLADHDSAAGPSTEPSAMNA